MMPTWTLSFYWAKQCRENHSQMKETQEEGGRAEMLGEDHKGRFGQVELEMLI